MDPIESVDPTVPAAGTPAPRKTCPTCKASLLLSAFGFNTAQRDGLQTVCRSCQAQYRRNWATANKDKARNRLTPPAASSPIVAEPAMTPAAASAIDAIAQVSSTTQVDPVAMNGSKDVSGKSATTSEGKGEPKGRATTTPAIEAPMRMAELPMSMVVASLTNPRRHFDPESLNALADSIRLHGLVTPILVRPLPGSRVAETYSDRRHDAPRPTHEVIAGERRWRASQLAGQRTIPVLIRDLDDTSVLQVQLVENLKREDLHPMEEAEGYDLLRKHTGMTPTEIGERIGKGKTYVYATLQLLDLEPEAREAFYAGKLTVATAGLVARHPPNMQVQLLKDITATDFHGDPMSFRRAKALVAERYMLRLSTAPFDTKDATLVPVAGACPQCPKRTGANPELFGDIDSRDTCTDTDCFGAKKAAHYDRIRADAEGKGMTVLVGREAREVMPTSSTLRGFVRLDDTSAFGGQLRTLSAVMGDRMPKPTLVEDPTTHEMVPVLALAVVGDLLKREGIAKAAKADPADAERELVAKVETAWRTQAIDAIHAATQARIVGLGAAVLRLLASMLLSNLPRDQRLHVCRLLGIGTIADMEGIQAAVRDCDPGRLESLLLLLLMQHDTTLVIGIEGRPTPAERIEAVAADVGVDLDALRARVRESFADTVRPKPPKARKGKTTPAEATAAIAQQLQALDDQPTA